MSSKSQANRGSKKRDNRAVVASRMWIPDEDPPIDFVIAAEDADMLRRAFKALGFDEPKEDAICPANFVERKVRRGKT